MRRHVSPTRRYVRVDISYASASCVCLSHADACDIYTFTVTFSPLGKSADRAIYFSQFCANPTGGRRDKWGIVTPSQSPPRGLAVGCETANALNVGHNSATTRRLLTIFFATV